MGSSYKFPSGLNNWVGSDKPERLDFVTDNEIIDENAMWKEDYDPTGEIATAGGIAPAVQGAVTASNINKAPNNHAAITSVHGAATTTEWGHVKLVNSTASTSTTDVPVAANVKAAYDLASAAIPKAGTSYISAVIDAHYTRVPNSAGYSLRGVHVLDSAGNAVATSCILMRRK